MRNRFAKILSFLTAKAPSTSDDLKSQALAEAATMTIDQALKKITAFRSFQELIDDSLQSGYRPTLWVGTQHLHDHADFLRVALAVKIADAFDAKMTELGQPQRAWRTPAPRAS